jgi:hypothetical protein
MKTKIKYMKKIIATGFALLAGITTIIAQNDNTKQALPEFNAIVISSSGDISLNQGSENSVSTKDGNIQDAVSAEVKDNTLFLKMKNGSDITVNFTKLNSIKLQSSCFVKSINQISADKLDVFLLGSSDLDIDMNVKELSTTIVGSGDAKYKGTAVSHAIKITGSGDVDAYGLTTTSANIVISGSGDARVNVTQDLKGIITGSGDITYFREPTNKDISVTGSGSYRMKGQNEETNSGDTTRLKIAHKIVLIINEKGEKRDTSRDRNKFDIYWAGFGLGVNGYLNANNQTKVPTGYNFLDLDYAKSINVTLNFWEQKIPIWKKHINIVTGMGLDLSNYRFNDKHNNLLKDSSYITAAYDSAVSFKKNKLLVSYLDVPLLLQFDTDPLGKGNRTIHLSAGVIGSLRIGSHTKQEYSIGGTTFKPKTRDDFNLNPFKYSAMVRIGYGKIDLYASYALNSMFKKNQGPQLYPFTIGITLAGF